VAEEFTQFAPLIVIAQPQRLAQLASLVVAGKADFVSRDANFIPLAAALVERALRREQEEYERAQQWREAMLQSEARSTREQPDPDSFAEAALRLVGGMLDSFEVVCAERSKLPSSLARRLDRIADLTFDLQQSLRLLAHQELEP
jgi:hypothetical protein